MAVCLAVLGVRARNIESIKTETLHLTTVCLIACLGKSVNYSTLCNNQNYTLIMRKKTAIRLSRNDTSHENQNINGKSGKILMI